MLNKEKRMSFIPVTKQRASFKDKGSARLTVRRTKSGASGLYVSVAVRGKKEFIITELDYDVKEIRLKPTDSPGEGLKLSSGTFTLSGKFTKEILPAGVRSVCIILNKKDDGWWYGSY
ncbi:hypothetical protein CLJ70_002945 [Escherichia coli]|nr:hypothetical protein [Escherichia coli]EFE1684460.1 hypothetical protein [Escherichia coli]